MLQLNFNDGRADKVFSGNSIYNDIYEYFGTSLDLSSDQSIDNEWGIGTHTLGYSICGYVGEIEISITQSPVTSVSAVLEKTSCYVNTNGFWIHDGIWSDALQETVEIDRYMYHVNLSSLTVNFNDGTSKTYSGNSNHIDSLLRAENMGLRLDFNTHQDPNSIWDVGANTVTVSVGGKSADIVFTVLESPVASINVTLTNSNIIEGTGGGSYLVADESGNVTRYYEYQFNDNLFESVIIFYKDGTDKAYSGEGICSQIKSDTGYDLTVTSDQNVQNIWDVGTHQFSVELMGYSSSFDVEIVENGIDSIRVLYKRNMLKDVDGSTANYTDIDEYGVETSGSYYCYDVNKNIYAIVVSYSDGTEKVFTTQSFSDYYGEYLYVESMQRNMGVVTQTGTFEAVVSAFNIYEMIELEIVDEEPVVVAGDYDCDGTISETDIELYRYTVVGFIHYVDEDLERLDINGDGFVDGFDLAKADLRCYNT